MAFRIVALLGLVALAAGAPQLLRTQEDADFDPNPQYTFSYSVNDAVSGDSKLQSESRSGDAVQGSYSVVEPDGSRRIVEYTADDLNGFQAVVHKEAGGRAIVAPAPAPILRTAPVVAPAPIARIAPVARPVYRTIAAPLASYAAPASSAVVHSSFNAPYATYAY